MKPTSLMVLLSLSLAALGRAEPLAKQDVAADAKWLVHCDLAGFRATKIGDFFGREVLDKKLAKPTTDLREQLGFEFDWRKIDSLTAYGADYQPQGAGQGVLLIRTTMDVRKALEGVMDRFAQGGNPDGGPVRRVQTDPVPLYAINNEVFIATPPGKPVLVSKSRADLDHAREVLLGQAPSLNGSPGLAAGDAPSNTFFLVASAQGFNENAPLPPRARILKMAESLRLGLGENGEELWLTVALKTKTLEVSQQIQQVVQGIIALVALGQIDNPDVRELAEATKVTGNDRLVTLEIRYPIDRAEAKLTAKERPQARARR